ncbi:MAG: lamin tail domain-containing protein [bacterium]|nr:lamin tail domain-containing protein [bacterium]
MKRKKDKKLYLFWILFLTAGFFILPKVVSASGHIVVNEIMTKDADSTKNEFIELYNPTDSSVNLEKYKLTKRTSSGNESNLVSSSKFLGIIPAQGYFLIAHPDYANKIGADLVYSGSSYSIADDNAVILYDKDEKIIDIVGFGTAKDFEGTSPAINPPENKSIERKTTGIDTDDNSKDFEINSDPSPQNSKYNSAKPASDSEPKPKVYSEKIRINEILPNPSGNELEDEYVEIYNYSDGDIDLENWEIKDAGSGKYSFPKGATIKKGNYLVIYRKDFKFAINNSDESIYLLNPDEVEVSSVFIGKKTFGSDISFSFDGIGWTRSSRLTPEKENEFDESPKISIKKDDKIYKNIYANFEVKTGDKSQKITWDFGDGHKSYLQETKHKYVEVGTYQVSLTVEGKSDDFVENFTVEVEKFDESKIKIISVKANPKGKDNKKETITIKNNSKKKINLEGWSVATGWKDLYNHPIGKKFILKPGETKELTRKYSAFTLNNKQVKIELRRPDGTVASKVKYSKKEGIQDDEVYAKTESGWEWQGTQTNADETQTDTDLTQTNTEETQNNTREIQNIENNSAEINASEKPVEETSDVIQTDEPKESGEILGAETENKTIESSDIKPQSGSFFQIIFWKANQEINSAVNFIVSFF